MSKASKAARPAANVAKRPDWIPRKISYATRYATASGGVTAGRMSLPAISMHIAARREAKKPVTLHDGGAA
mgnify:CR=1 FL=1